jgi:hypothetical protein
MTMFEERRRALEDKYILDFERSFKVRARRNRLMAEWAAKQIGRNDVEAYVNEIEAAGLESGDTSLMHKLVSDFNESGRPADEVVLREKLHELMYDAAEAMESEAHTSNPI